MEKTLLSEAKLPVVRKWGKQTPLERFHSKYKVINGCWIWQGAKEKNGYAKFTVGKITTSGHRFAYHQLIGPIPVGLTLDHLCRNTSCVNPLHLQPVTMRENLLRGNTFQAANARKTHCPLGHPYDEQNTYIRPDGKGRVCKACVKKRKQLR